MNYRSFQYRHLISTFLSVGIFIASGGSTLAESSPPDEIKALTEANNSKTSYTDRGQPTLQTGQASRGSCSSGINSEDLLAYIPSQTDENHPSFQFKIPFESSRFHSVEFWLMEDNAEAKMIYETQLTSDQVSPDFHINLPQTSTELEVNKSYAWKLIVHCSDPTNAVDMQDALYMEGSIKRVELTAGSPR